MKNIGLLCLALFCIGCTKDNYFINKNKYFIPRENNDYLLLSGKDTVDLSMLLINDTIYSAFEYSKSCRKLYAILPLKMKKGTNYSYTDHYKDCCSNMPVHEGRVSIELDSIKNDIQLGKLYYFIVATLYNDDSSYDLSILRYFIFSERLGFIYYRKEGPEELSKEHFPFK